MAFVKKASKSHREQFAFCNWTTGTERPKKHYEVNEQLFPQSVQDRLKHGTKCEVHAVATLVGRFLPIHFPEYHFVEEGCYVLAGENINVLGEVSPDGSIRRLNSDNDDAPILGKAIAAVEIKCPFSSERQLPVHYTLLETDVLIYVSYSNESTTFHRVHFDQVLWERIWGEATELYDKHDIVEPTRRKPQLKSFKELLSSFVKTKC